MNFTALHSLRRRARAFTLIELLVAGTLAVLIAGFLIGILGNTMDLWSRTSGRVDAAAQGRLVLDQLAQDLQGAIFRDDGGTKVWFAVRVLPDTSNSTIWATAQAPTRQKPGNASAGTDASSLDLAATRPGLLERGRLADTRNGVAGMWLRFFTTSRGTNAATASLSTPVAVSYQIIRHLTASNPSAVSSDQRYLLYRSEVRPVQLVPNSANFTTARPGVLESGFDLNPNLTTSNYAITRPPTTNDGSQLGDPYSIKRPNHQGNILADNVIDFGVRLYVRDSTKADGLRLIYPVNAAGQLANVTTDRLATTSSTTGTDATRFPEVVDVMVRILTPRGAALIAALESNPNKLATTRPQAYRTDAEWWWAIALQNSQVFTRRIILPAQPQ
ncbi:MAG: hypothetical protein HZA31_12440 [Opitutae bacterium]|nr:hypothetical protein [Opitutae bacterium]